MSLANHLTKSSFGQDFDELSERTASVSHEILEILTPIDQFFTNTYIVIGTTGI